MRAIARWSVENRVTVNILMLIILAGGLISLLRMKRESLPQFSLDMISISVAYPGATPEEIEEGICVKVEEAIKGVEGVKKIISTATEGYGTIVVELESNVSNTQKVLDDIKSEVDRIETFPEEAKDPIVKEITLREPVIYVAIYGNAGELTLRKLAEKVRDDLVDTPAITQAELAGVRNYEISIEVSEATLQKYGLTFDEVAQAVKRGSLDLPAGTIKTPYEEISLRTKGQRYTGEEFESIPLRTLPDGTIIRLGEVAHIIDGFEDTEKRIRFDGMPAVVVQIVKTPEQDLIEIADTVHRYVAETRNKLPEGVQISSFIDHSELVRSRIDLLVRNGRQGLILVFLTLALFLQFRLSFWVSMGIPVSFMGAFWVLGLRGDSINMISLFAFIMALGLVVDDAIIIGENIFTKYSKGLNPIQASIEGTAQVGWPVIMTILTTVVAFLPLFYVSGIMGKFIAVMPVAIIATLLFSLFEALFILPAHLAHTLERQERRAQKKTLKNTPTRIQRFRETTLKKVIQRYYAPALNRVIRYRYISSAIALSILIMAVGTIASGRVPFVLIPKMDSDWLVAKVTFPYGTPIEDTASAVIRIEKAAQRLNHEYAGKTKSKKNHKVIRHIFSMIGEIMPEGREEGEYGSHCGEVILELLPSEERGIHYTDLLNRWRELAGDIPGTEKLIFTTPVMGPGGAPIEIKLVGKDFDTLQRAADELKQQLATYPGTFDISDDFRPGKPELKLKTKPTARVLGITMSDLARQVRQGFYGDEALRIQRGRDDVKVMVRYTEAERHTRGSVDKMRIRTPSGDAVPLATVAEVTEGKGYSVIHRIDRERTITVVSDLDESVANAREIILDLQKSFLPELMLRYPDIRYSLGGQEETTKEAVGSLAKGYILALLAIYGLLATQFRSYIQPVIVMTAIPFGLIGAVVGHLVMGLSLTLMSLFGIVALSGIVVNDSLVLIDFINQSVREKLPVFDSVYQAGQARFRPVLLTTITTLAGLLPIMLEKSFQAKFLIPMVVSITFGLLFATLLTLFLVPCFYLILDDIVKLLTPREPKRSE
ncbi:efflux RND transporter permease subunit [Candidatus Sumerlaeota bacterium]|nr:efflux RND transporter permease subunit [Candidatus Sumerlaeota bacterium]